MTKTTLRTAFWVDALGSGLSASVALLTLLWRDWIEAAFGLDPDHGNGSAEWFAVAVLLGISVSAGVLARRQWLRAHAV